ncbi:MAG: LytR family transcriptional regulator [Ruminococcaceae bacterium]|nr:LytR family transcriptional regulator [Oscillospiraceae bacterium]
MKKKKNAKMILLCLLLPIVIVVSVVAGFSIPLVVSFYENSFEKGELVERIEPYVMPEKNEEEIKKNLKDNASNVQAEALPEIFDNGDKENKNQDGEINQSGDSGATIGLDRHYNYLTSFTETDKAISVYGKTPIYRVDPIDSDVINILILGTDSRDVSRERGRSDSMIVASYNKNTGKIKLISILRDSLVPVEGHGWNRINSAYSYDGVGLAINTVNQLFGLDIQFFVVVDFTGARDFINHVGGVDIVISEKEAEYYSKYSGEKIEAGLCHMDGALAMTHMRTRKIDSDFVRSERQREVIVALANKIVNEKTIPEIYNLADYAFKLVKTNISLTDMMPVLTSVATNAKGLSIESQNVPYNDSFEYEYYSGMAVISFDIDEAKNRMHEFLYETKM